ncbi:MAG TPA: prephenate dehydratase [Lutibacter sp.]|nr:prephenate dehydratase [Lutibacter sp.]
MNFKQNIAIQGIKGSYHHEVVGELFGNEIELLECDNFSEIPPLLLNKKADKAVMAIENTIAGAILPNYALIDEYKLQICGEYYLPIHHQLLAIKGQKLSDIKEVRSHPMALEQCRKFFRAYPHIKLIEGKDTAKVAKEIQEQQLMGIAAIASKIASKIYNLNIIADEIQTNKTNYTRFVILAKKNGNTPDNFNKASIKFRLNHKTGSLLEILQVFSDNDINMSKIQSLPIVEKPWEYAFFVDLLFDNKTSFIHALRGLKNKTNELKILGKYISNKKIES